MRQILFRVSTLLPSKSCRFRFLRSFSGSSCTKPKMNSTVGKEVATLSHNYTPASSDGSCSVRSCDGEIQAENQILKRKPLVSPHPILRHLGLLTQTKSTSITKPQQQPRTGGLEATTSSQPESSMASNSAKDEKDRASLSSVAYSSLTSEQISGDRVAWSNELAEVDSDKGTHKGHYERDNTGILEEDWHLPQISTSNENNWSLPTISGKRKKSPESRKKPASADYVGKGRKRHSDCSPGKNHVTPVAAFDICECTTRRPIEKAVDSFIMETIPIHELSDEEGHQLVLRPGMVLLKRFLTHDEQVSIVKKCRDLGLGPGGFYRPGYKDGAKLRLQMMCLGLDWDPQTRKYSKRRAIDTCPPPDIPNEFRSLVERAIGDSQDVIAREPDTDSVESILPMMSTDICIVNFYTIAGRLGLHQDRDESAESIAKGLPVVSLSIGDAAEFLYGEERQIDRAEKVILESGDVLIFGGDSRLAFHGVQSIIPDSAPSALIKETGLRPGRLNLTFRQY